MSTQTSCGLSPSLLLKESQVRLATRWRRFCSSVCTPDLDVPFNCCTSIQCRMKWQAISHACQDQDLAFRPSEGKPIAICNVRLRVSVIVRPSRAANMMTLSINVCGQSTHFMIRREGSVPVRRHSTEVQDMPHTSDRDQSVSVATLSPRVPTDDICLNGNGIVYSPPKSAKRKRAEELLEQRYAQQQKPFRAQILDSGDATTVSACSHEARCSRLVYGAILRKHSSARY